MKARLLAVYAALFAAAVGVFFGVRELGSAITPSGEAHAAPAKPSGVSGDGLFHVLLASSASRSSASGSRRSSERSSPASCSARRFSGAWRQARTDT
jgi:hypothetical protein